MIMGPSSITLTVTIGMAEHHKVAPWANTHEQFDVGISGSEKKLHGCFIQSWKVSGGNKNQAEIVIVAGYMDGYEKSTDIVDAEFLGPIVTTASWMDILKETKQFTFLEE
jgi:hypothetical protein